MVPRRNEKVEGARMNRRAAFPPSSVGRSYWNSWLCLFLVAGWALGMCGCAGYRFGPTNPELTAGKSIQINFFENKTLEPRLAVAEVVRVEVVEARGRAVEAALDRVADQQEG